MHGAGLDPTTLERLVDDRLEPEARARLVGTLAGDAAASAVVEAHRDISQLLRARFAPVLDEPIPRRLLEAARAPVPARGRRPRAAWALAAAVAAVALLGGVGGWLWRGVAEHSPAWQTLVEQATEARRRAVAPGEPAAARALHAVLGEPIAVPALGAEGFRLVGGDVAKGAKGPATRLVYDDEAGRRVTLYVRADLANAGDVKFRFAPGRGLTVLYWLDGPRGYALLGDIDRERMLRVAHQVYDQIGA